MAFDVYTKLSAFQRANGKCESCGKRLTYMNNGREGRGAWEAHHKHHVASGGKSVLSNCRVLCWECHKGTF